MSKTSDTISRTLLITLQPINFSFYSFCFLFVSFVLVFYFHTLKIQPLISKHLLLIWWSQTHVIQNQFVSVPFRASHQVPSNQTNLHHFELLCVKDKHVIPSSQQVWDRAIANSTLYHIISLGRPYSFTQQSI